MIFDFMEETGITLSYQTAGFIVFFAVVLALCCLMRAQVVRKLVLLLANGFFYYAMGGFSALELVLLTSAAVYTGSALMGIVYVRFERASAGLDKKEKRRRLTPYKKRARGILFATLAVILAIFVYVKAGGLLHFSPVDSLSSLTPGHVLAPLGISYYTFSCIGYLADVYWRKVPFEKNGFDLLIAILYFPIIVEGPISNYGRLLSQLKKLPAPNYRTVCFGLQRMIWGFFKKLVVADRLTQFTTPVFASVGDYAGAEMVIAVLFNALAIYADFSGCMDIVIGASQALGIELEENFRQPFFSRTAAEFWRRWHITLGAWFRDYVYMPLAMGPYFRKRAAEVRKKRGTAAAQLAQGAVPLLIVWICTGLWHGTGTDYLVWGLYWGSLMIAGMAFQGTADRINQALHVDPDSFSHRLFQMIRTFLIFCGGRMLTATGEPGGFFLILHQVFSESRLNVLFDGSLYSHGLEQKDWYVAIVGIVAMWVVDMLHERKIRIREVIASQPLILRWAVYIGSILFVLVYGIYGASYSATAFAYGAF